MHSPTIRLENMYHSLLFPIFWLGFSWFSCSLWRIY